MLIGDRRIVAKDANSLPVFDPATGREVHRAPLASTAEVNSAVESASRAFATWRLAGKERRAEVLDRTARLIDERVAEIALTITVEQGKPLSEAEGEVAGVGDFLHWAAQKLRSRPEPKPFAEGSLYRQRRPTPLGVVAIASPWNFPLAAAADHCIAALAQGCTAVVKPPETCPTAFALFATLLLEAGLPVGGVNVVTGDPGSIVQQLIAHPLVRKLAYTGSTEIGRIVATHAAHALKPTILELGGNAPTIVMPSTDVGEAVSQIAGKKFYNAGQNCVAPNRIYVHSDIYDRFCEAMEAYVLGVMVGAGTESGTTMGPLATPRQRQRVADSVAAALRTGGRLVASTQELPDDGFFHPAMIVSDLDNTSPLFSNEVFGPVASIARYSSADPIVEWANGTPAGLAAYVFGDEDEAHQAAQNLDVGMVAINTCSIGSYDLPFGGVKSSGWGHVYAEEGLDGFVAEKAWTSTFSLP